MFREANRLIKRKSPRIKSVRGGVGVSWVEAGGVRERLEFGWLWSVSICFSLSISLFELRGEGGVI